MKNHIEGYYNFEIIKGYQKLDDKIVVTYLNGYSVELDIKDEEKVLVLMEEQGRDYAKEFNSKKCYLFRVASGCSGLVVVLLGTLNWLENICVSGNNELMVIGAIGGSALMAIDVILFKKLFKNLSYKLNRFDDQEKYNFYFKNKDVLGSYISINELDDCSISEIKEIVSWKKKVRKKR